MLPYLILTYLMGLGFVIPLFPKMKTKKDFSAILILIASPIAIPMLIGKTLYDYVKIQNARDNEQEIRNR